MLMGANAVSFARLLLLLLMRLPSRIGGFRERGLLKDIEV